MRSPLAGSRVPVTVTEQWGPRAAAWRRARPVERPGWVQAPAVARCPSANAPASPPLPPTPYPHPPVSAREVWPPWPGFEIPTWPSGAGCRLSGYFCGKGLLPKWIIPTAPGVALGDSPPAANALRRQRTNVKMTWNRSPRGPPPTAMASLPTQ